LIHGAHHNTTSSLRSTTRQANIRCELPLKTRTHRAISATFVTVAVVAVLLAGILPCPFHAVTGLPCPGCGMSRAAKCVFRGALREAHWHHPLILPALLGGALLAALELRNYLVTGQIGTALGPRAAKWVSWIFIALMLSVWIARMCGALGGIGGAA
jgi:hypothetical protein